MTILVTGGAGFIGSNFILHWFEQMDETIVNLDKLTYAGNMTNLASLSSDGRHQFVQGDIGDQALLATLLACYQPRAIINFAAESHVDRSILNPAPFIQTNILGVFNLLETVREYWQAAAEPLRASFRFLQVSTDEVFGSLAADAPPAKEDNRYAPNSPYSASKASGDHLVRAYCRTYGIPVLTSHCSNNYGPYHFPEKLIPLTIHNALAGKALPVYGDGQQIRDWLYVKDHCQALQVILSSGKAGETYNISGKNEKTNIEVIRLVCSLLDRLRPRSDGQSYAGQIRFIPDRPGHDIRYALDASRLERELGWLPAETFESGMNKTVDWYLGNAHWVKQVTNGSYIDWLEAQYH